MIQCIYDNPNTFCREWWVDGYLQASMSAELIFFILIPNAVHQNIWFHTHSKLPAPFEHGKVHEGDIMAMKIKDEVIHQRKIFVSLDETELRAILSEAVAKMAKFHLTKNTKILVHIGSKDKAGTAGFEPYAEVTLVYDYEDVQSAE